MKKIFSFLLRFIPPAFILYFFLFPFIWEVWVLIILILFIWYLIVRKTKTTYSIIYNGVLILVCFLIIIFGPIIFLKSPVYILYNETENFNIFKILSNSDYITPKPLVKNKSDSGTILIFNDTLHKFYYDIWSKLSDRNFNIIDQKQYAGKKYLIAPIKTKFENIKSGLLSDADSRTIWVPLKHMIFDINLPMKIDEHAETSFAYGFGAYSLISFTYPVSSELPPWEGVEIENSDQILEIARFVSTLDRAINMVKSENYEDTMQMFDYASSIAPNKLEKARVYCLVAKLSNVMLRGNIINAQSVAILNRVYSDLLIDEGDFKFSGHPVEYWIIGVLGNQYSQYGSLFRNKLDKLSELKEKVTDEDNLRKTLENSARQAVVNDFKRLKKRSENNKITMHESMDEFFNLGSEYDDERNYFISEENRISKSNADEFINESKSKLKMTQYNKELFLALAEKGIILKYMSSLLEIIETRDINLGFPELKEKINAYEIVANTLPSELRINYMKYINAMKKLEGVIRLISDQNIQKEEAFQGLKKYIFNTDIFQKLKRTRALVESFYSMKDIENETNNVLIHNIHLFNSPPDTEWWTVDYIEWFTYISIFAVLKNSNSIKVDEDKAKQFFKELNISDLLSNYRDQSSIGRLYVPTLILSAILQDDKKSLRYIDLNNRLSKLLGCSYVDLIKFQPGDTMTIKIDGEPLLNF